MINAELLDILVCPENKTAVREIDSELLEKINAAIAAGTLKKKDGETITETIEGGLVREDNKYLYVIRDGIPVMLVDEAVALDQLD
ncbi:MAG: hypothetical protein KAH38_05320 [Candidatus Hydrogenedentes bacterium]|nr:hypothetical protein [Candidatus Hydrogenedentota bacterium]